MSLNLWGVVNTVIVPNCNYCNAEVGDGSGKPKGGGGNNDSAVPPPPPPPPLEDIDKVLSFFYKHLLKHGYLTPKLIPLFEKSITNAISYLSLLLQQQKLRAKIKAGKPDERIFFHIPYQPQNPSSGIIQHLW
jgi:hypothetical protein